MGWMKIGKHKSKKKRYKSGLMLEVLEVLEE